MREMKDGGVQWIGEIPEKWAIVSTKSLQFLYIYSMICPAPIF